MAFLQAEQLIAQVRLVLPDIFDHALALHDLEVLQGSSRHDWVAAEGNAVQEHMLGLDQTIGNPVAKEDRTHWLVAAGEALCARDDVGFVLVALGSEPLAEAAIATDRLVSGMQDAVLLADLADALVILGVWRKAAAGILDGLHDHHRDGRGILELDYLSYLVGTLEVAATLIGAVLAAIRIGWLDVTDASHQRLERRADAGNACQREGAVGGAVIRDLAGNHLASHWLATRIVIFAGQLDRAFDTFRAARHEERAVEAIRSDLGELRCELDRFRMRVGPVGVVRQLHRLLEHRRTDLLAVRVTDLDGKEPAQEIHVAIAVRVLEENIVSPHHHRVLIRVEPCHLREVKPQVLHRHFLQCCGIYGRHQYRLLTA